MGNVTTVGIRFCGGCNPRIDRGTIAAELKNRLEKLGITVHWNRLDGDVIIYVSGCTTSCACRWHGAKGSSVIVAGTTVNYFDTAEEDIVPLCMAIVLKHISHEKATGVN